MTEIGTLDEALVERVREVLERVVARRKGTGPALGQEERDNLMLAALEWSLDFDLNGQEPGRPGEQRTALLVAALKRLPRADWDYAGLGTDFIQQTVATHSDS